MSYSKQTWINTSAGETPLNATRLNYMEDGIANAYDGEYLIDAATPYDPGLSTDEFIVYRDGATPSTGKVTLDAIKDYMAANGLSTLTLEQVQDSVAGMLVAGTSVTLTYNDGANTLTIDAATPNSDEYVQDLVAAMFVEGTDIDITYNDGAGTITITSLASGGGGSDPYGLLTDIPATALAVDEFTGAISGSWTTYAPGGGSITWAQGNHKLTALVKATSTHGGQVRPLSSFGGAWGAGVVLETELSLADPGHVARLSFVVSDGTTSSANALGVHLYGGNSNEIFAVQGTLGTPYSGSFTSCGTTSFFNHPMRLRIASTDGDTVHFYVSIDGVSWLKLADLAGGATYSLTSLAWTPTHVGYAMLNTPYTIASDYIRRIS